MCVIVCVLVRFSYDSQVVARESHLNRSSVHFVACEDEHNSRTVVELYEKRACACNCVGIYEGCRTFSVRFKHDSRVIARESCWNRASVCKVFAYWRHTCAVEESCLKVLPHLKIVRPDFLVRAKKSNIYFRNKIVRTFELSYYIYFQFFRSN